MGKVNQVEQERHVQRFVVGWRLGVWFRDDVVIWIVVFMYKLCTVNPNLSLIIQRNCSFSAVGDVGNIGRTLLFAFIVPLILILNLFSVLTYLLATHHVYIGRESNLNCHFPLKSFSSCYFSLLLLQSVST